MDAPVHIKIADIDVRDRLREVDASKVEALKQSFAETGHAHTDHGSGR
ncbi:hypothetical protein [Brucella sp. MAB-22]